MPMPVLDPARFYATVLADPSHTLPLPKDLGGRNFFAEGEVVDSAHPFYAHLLADGSLKRKPAEAVEAAPSRPGKPDAPVDPKVEKPADAPIDPKA